MEKNPHLFILQMKVFTAIHKHYTIEQWMEFAASNPDTLQVGIWLSSEWCFLLEYRGSISWGNLVRCHHSDQLVLYELICGADGNAETSFIGFVYSPIYCQLTACVCFLLWSHSEHMMMMIESCSKPLVINSYPRICNLGRCY